MASSAPARRLFWPAALAAAALLAGGCGGGSPAPKGHAGSPDGWLTYVEAHASPYAIHVVKADGSQDALLPGRASADADSPAFSAAAGLIAFTQHVQGGSVLVLHDWSDDAERLLDTGTLHPASPAWSPDGRTLAFEAIPEGSSTSDLYLVPAAGGTPAALAPSSSTDASPAWAADGLSVFFVSLRSGAWEVHRVGTDGTGLAQVTTGARPIGRIAVSPDGATIAFAKGDAQQVTHLVLHSLADGSERTLSTDAAEWDPAFDATGTKIAVVSLLFGDPELVIRDVATGALVQRITHQVGLEVSPAFAR